MMRRATGGLKRTLLVALCGGIGGGTNMFLFIISRARDSDSGWGWPVSFLGAAHGALLAAVPMGVAGLLPRERRMRRLVVALPAAWLAGWLAYIPLTAVAMHSDYSWIEHIAWPLIASSHWAYVLALPLLYFGLVALLYSVWLAVRPSHVSRVADVSATMAAAILGSLCWWWAMWDHWELSLLHGAIWGACVGLGTPAAERSR